VGRAGKEGREGSPGKKRENDKPERKPVVVMEHGHDDQLSDDR
jgi:hypothetical protein